MPGLLRAFTPSKLLSRLLLGLSLVSCALLVSCADTGYLLQSVSGHLKLMHAARPIDQWLADASTPPALKQRLQLARDIRRYAISTLHLPDNASYQRYAQLDRRAVVWNVVAAPTDSLTLKTWCFPVTGCIGYRGYFDEHDAQMLANALKTDGLEASVYGVPAYSTLGWTNWLGGDPLLSTFIHYPQGELARMVFHEMAHQVLYIKDDTAFNESFATSVEHLGSNAWLASQANPAAAQEYATLDARRKGFRELTAKTRQQLLAVYATRPGSAPRSQEQLLVDKSAVYAAFRASYAELKQSWGGYTGYDAWVAGANNAAFGALAAYDDWVDAFEAVFKQQNGDWVAFYAAVRELSELPREQRTLRLKQLQTATNVAMP